MRTIKFRAYHKKQDRMFDVFGIGKDFVTEDTMDGIDPGNNCFQGDYLDDLEIMQVTGLKDKNGKEIYIGDIIEFVDKWEWYRGEWAPKFFFASPEKHKKLEKEFEKLPTEKRVVGFDIKEGVNFSVYDLEQGRWEVIGNIHQNPDLL